MEWKQRVKKYGLLKATCRLIGDKVYILLFPVIKAILLRSTKIDDHKIVFVSTPAFSDNAKALFEYLKSIDVNEQFLYVWLIRKDEKKPQLTGKDAKNVVILNRDTVFHDGCPLKTLKELLSSKYVFFTHRSPLSGIGIRKGQVCINLWHGCGYKDTEHKEGTWSKKNPCTVSIVPGTVFVHTKSKFWGCEESKILPIGYPRYDLLLREDSGAETFCRSLSGGDRKRVLWMPTFRKSLNNIYPEDHLERNYDLPLLNSNEELHILDELCSGLGIHLCIKRHPLQVNYQGEKERLTNITFVDNKLLVGKRVDLYAFLKYSDGLISDYSSVAIDYLLLDHPIAFALDDFEQYKNSRGFVFENPLDYMPGHHLYTFEDMKQFLQDVAEGKDTYAKVRHKLMPEVHNPCDNYCERIWKTVQGFVCSEK